MHAFHSTQHFFLNIFYEWCFKINVLFGENTPKQSHNRKAFFISGLLYAIKIKSILVN